MRPARDRDPLDSTVSNRIDLSIVIPIFDEALCLPELRRRLFATVAALEPLRAEVIFVNDGSTDGSGQILEETVAAEPRAHVIHLTRNFGHHEAMTAGLDHARGRLVCLMDGDLQDRPEELPRLLHALDSDPDVDVVYAIRTARQDPWVKRLTSRMFMKLMSAISGAKIPANCSTYRVMTRRCVDALNQCRERSRALAGLVAWLGFKHAGVSVVHGARFAGKTKYGPWKTFRLGITMLMGFSRVLLHWASMAGFAISILSLLAGCLYVYRKLVYGIPVPGYTSIIVSVFFMGGITLVVLGILGEYIGQIYAEVQGRPLYVVREIREGSEEQKIGKADSDSSAGLPALAGVF